MSASERTASLSLTPDAPTKARRIVESFVQQLRAEGGVISDYAATGVALLASELIADGLAHGSDSATMCIRLGDPHVFQVEMFDGPRRRWIATTAPDDLSSTIRTRLLYSLADNGSSHEIGDGHFAHFEIVDQ